MNGFLNLVGFTYLFCLCSGNIFMSMSIRARKLVVNMLDNAFHMISNLHLVLIYFSNNPYILLLGIHHFERPSNKQTKSKMFHLKCNVLHSDWFLQSSNQLKAFKCIKLLYDLAVKGGCYKKMAGSNCLDENEKKALFTVSMFLWMEI